MPFTIPNSADAGFADQAEPDKVDFDILSAGCALSGVKSGCAVTAQGSPDMTVAVAAGIVIVNGLPAVVTAGNVTITTANATNPRFDLIAVDKAGAKSAVAGTAAANAVFPAIPADSVILAAVYVPANDTAINTNQITDKRVSILPQLHNFVRSGQAWYYAAQGTGGTLAGASGVMFACPLWLPAGITVDRIGIEVTTLGASAVMRLGIYKDSGWGYPGALVLDAGTVSGTTTGNKEITISQAITEAGLYWLTYAVNSGTAPSVRALSTHATLPLLNLTTFTTSAFNISTTAVYTVSGITGALPDPFGTPPLTNANVAATPRVYVRIT